MPRGRKLGFILAAIHLVVVGSLAAWILIASKHDRESPLYWVYLLAIDFPVIFVMWPLSHMVDGWANVHWLPGLAGEWTNFLLPLICLSLVGTLWWYVIGWLIRRIMIRIFQRR
jgi:ABC-type glycerol-3-phosphate transport system permease component